MKFIETVERCIRQANKSDARMDWIGMEQTIRDVFEARANCEVDDFHTLLYISEIIGSFTKRGYPDCKELD